MTASSTGASRLLPRSGRLADLDAHLSQHGPVPYRGGARLLLPTVEDSGLTGRGGAAFPLARKMAAVLDAAADTGRRPVVVGNGAEGEPASHKDKTLLWTSPHLVLDGLQLAAEAVGARRAVLYLHHHPALAETLDTALRQRRRARIDHVRIEVVEAEGGFLAGQETAVVNALNGGEPIPMFLPERISTRGVKGRPTLLSNVETLAQLALLARRGSDWWRGVGTDAEPGSMLVTVHAPDTESYVQEVALGTPLASVVPLADAGAVLVGGYHGAWVSTEAASRLRLTNVELRPLGSAVGAGVVAALPSDRCGVVESAAVLRYLAVESAGQCGPCLNGLPSIAAAMTQLAQGRATRDVLQQLHRWAGLVERRGACAHPDGSVRFLRSALVTFEAEVQVHLDGGCTGRDYRQFLPVPRDVAASHRAPRLMGAAS